MMVHHRVNRCATTDQATSRPVQTTRRKARLLNGIIIPVMFGVEELSETQGHFALRDAGIISTSFKQEDRDIRVFGELAGQHGASRARSNDHWATG